MTNFKKRIGVALGLFVIAAVCVAFADSAVAGEKHVHPKKAYVISTKDVTPGIAPLHEESNSWMLGLTDDLEFYITEIRPGGAALKDMHPDADHIFYFLAGYGYQIIDGERFDHGPNDAVFIPRGAQHEMYVTGQETLRFVVTLSPARADKKEQKTP